MRCRTAAVRLTMAPPTRDVVLVAFVVIMMIVWMVDLGMTERNGTWVGLCLDSHSDANGETADENVSTELGKYLVGRTVRPATGP